MYCNALVCEYGTLSFGFRVPYIPNTVLLSHAENEVPGSLLLWSPPSSVETSMHAAALTPDARRPAILLTIRGEGVGDVLPRWLILHQGGQARLAGHIPTRRCASCAQPHDQTAHHLRMRTAHISHPRAPCVQTEGLTLRFTC